MSRYRPPRCGKWPLTELPCWLIVAVAAGMTLAVFVLDLQFRVGIAAGVPYIAVVLVTSWGNSRLVHYAATLVVSLMTIIGFFIPDPGGDAFWIGVENRIIALCSIWVTALLADLAARQTTQLREREARLRAVLDAAVNAIMSFDAQGAIRSWNHAAKGMFGLTDAQLAKQTISQLMPELPFDPQGAEFVGGSGLSTPKVICREHATEAVRGDGHRFPVEMSVTWLELAEGPHFVVLVHDITQRQQFQQRLLQSERLAAIGQAMAGLAHESRNALQRSQACIELLADSADCDDETHGLLADIQQAQDELHYLYEEVREYAAPCRISPEPTALAELIHDAWQLITVPRSGRKAELRLSGATSNATALVDPFAMRQLFRNLFENALAAAGDFALVEVELTAGAGSGHDELEIRVRDNGPGISTAVLERIFEPFFTTKTRGTGLGLAICRRIVNAHGGEIQAAGREARGAEFTIRLPEGFDAKDTTDCSRRRRTADASILSESPA